MNLLVGASILALAALVQDHSHAHPEPLLGSLAFETSCSRTADSLVKRGLGWLHSFEYAQAAEAFGQAGAADPDCAISYWGVAMSHYHPLWAPPSEAEMAAGKAAIASAAKATKASERERAYLEAIATFYRDSDRLDHKSRALAYSAAMEELHRRYPDDREAAVFHALSLVAAGMMDKDPTFAREKSAAAILNRIFEQEPDHPGVTHYLIHGFDYPALARMALPAARRYAAIAPDSPHAQHMPSHIFVRLGLWDESIKSNLASESASRTHARMLGLADSSSERLHAIDYLAYAYLQTGQDRMAQDVLATLNSIQRADPAVFSVAYAATAIPARLVLERRNWSEAAALELEDNVRRLAPLDKFTWAEAHVHFARAVGAARKGDAGAARSEVAKLAAIEQALVVPPGTYDWRTKVSIERQIAEAWLALAEGRGEEAARRMRAAADLDDSSEKHPVTPGAILPAREQLGELLLELGRPAEALAEFEQSLTRSPRRLAGLYGAARSARLAGKHDKATLHYAGLADLTRDGDGARAEVKEARAFLSGLAEARR